MTNKPNSLRQAATFVASPDTEMADALLEQMPEETAGLVRRMMVDLGDVDPREQDNVIHEFFRIGPLVLAQEPAGIELDRPPSDSVVDELHLGGQNVLATQ